MNGLHHISSATFHEQISSVILQRGREYFENGHVKKMQEQYDTSGITYLAAVKGKKETYHVSVQLDPSGETIIAHECSCLFDGETCKHQVAVLFSILEGPAPEQKEQKARAGRGKPEKENPAEKILALLTVDDLRSYLKELTDENREIKKHFISTFASRTATDKSDYKAIITSALQGLRGARSFTDRGSVHRAMIPINKLLEQAENHLNRGSHESAIYICQAVMEKLVPALQYVDDSNGWMGNSINQAMHLLHLLAELVSDPKMRKLLFDWFVKTAKQKDMTSWDWGWEMAILAATMATPAEEKQIIALATTLRSEKTDNEWINDYHAGMAAQVILAYHVHHKTAGETLAYIIENVKFPAIRERAVKHFLDQGNIDQAIDFCREGITQAQDKNLPGQVNVWYEQLLAIYQAHGNTEGVLDCAEYLFYHGTPDTGTYHLLKQNLPAGQWKQKRHELLSELERRLNWPILITIYLDEGQKEQAMNVLLRARTVRLTNEFSNALLPEFRQPLENLYFDLVRDILRNGVDRRSYHEAAAILRNMKSHFDVTNIQLFAKQLRETYPHRPALLSELGGL